MFKVLSRPLRDIAAGEPRRNISVAPPSRGAIITAGSPVPAENSPYLIRLRAILAPKGAQEGDEIDLMLADGIERRIFVETITSAA